MPRVTVFICALVVSSAAFWGAASAQDNDFSKFSQSAETTAYAIDHAPFTDFLRAVVIDVGNSDRVIPKRPPRPHTGTRIARGAATARSRYRFEANRLVYHWLTAEVIEYLTAYVDGLEQVSNEIDFAQLSKDEQLAFWLNLHNAKVIEQIALQYPVTRTNRLRPAGQRRGDAFEDKILTIAGVPMSLNDIRENVVYQYWDDPLVVYGFYTGSIGSPSIQTVAYTPQNLNIRLRRCAEEFIGSLRGFEGRDGNLRVSKIYDTARPHFFPNWPEDLIAHMREYAPQDVTPLLADATSARATVDEAAIADLTGGENNLGSSRSAVPPSAFGPTDGDEVSAADQAAGGEGGGIAGGISRSVDDQLFQSDIQLRGLPPLAVEILQRGWQRGSLPRGIVTIEDIETDDGQGAAD